MDMEQCTIYIRLYKRKTIEVKKWVTIGELADIAAPSEVKSKVATMRIFCVPDTSCDGRYIVTIMNIIDEILKTYPKADIQSIGDPDAVVEYHYKETKPKDPIEWLKVIGVCIIIFAGAFSAIMAYNTDISLPEMFITIHRMITGQEVEQPYFLSIPYSIGICVGVIVFFNHIGFKKITQEPTPMQVEMKKYEQDVEDCEIESITDRRRGEPS
ncbi:MAG: stage V sporulation protein AA [Cellulosilyticum sp.]|nr:stage V sporulation protein AA [Cellulosilyticum sp.]